MHIPNSKGSGTKSNSGVGRKGLKSGGKGRVATEVGTRAVGRTRPQVHAAKSGPKRTQRVFRVCDGERHPLYRVATQHLKQDLTTLQLESVNACVVLSKHTEELGAASGLLFTSKQDFAKSYKIKKD